MTVTVCRVLAGMGMALAVSGCVHNPNNLTTMWIDSYAHPNPTPAAFYECHGFKCAKVSSVSLNRKQWGRVTEVFKPRAKDAGTERAQISKGVSLIRVMVGAQTGTAVNQWTHTDTIILPNLGDMSQLDCIDETVNTWTYLTLMQRAGLFRFHRVASAANAGLVHDLRNTAVLQEIDGAYFAVDPMLVGFAEPPPVIPLTAWLASWPPDLSKNDAPGKKPERAPNHQLRVEAEKPPAASRRL